VASCFAGAARQQGPHVQRGGGLASATSRAGRRDGDDLGENGCGATGKAPRLAFQLIGFA
jgi:hypothetical protein